MSLHYLEDFLEYTNELPQIFCDRLTKVRELDLEARNREDHTRQLKGDLLSLKHDRGPNPQPRSAEIVKLADEIDAELDRIVELTGEKIKIIASLETLMLKFSERLDEETEKFKLEIEADSPGCTVRLDDRANEEMYAFMKIVPARLCAASAYGGLGSRRSFGQDPSNRLLMPGSDIPPLPTYGDTRLSAHGTLINENWHNDATTQTNTPPRTSKGRFAPAPLELTEMCRVQLADSAVADQPVSIFVMAPRPKSKRLIDKPKFRVTVDASVIPSGDSEAAPPEEEEDDSKKYCFCEGLGDGLMVACDSPTCVQEWFHGDCVGIKSEAQISGKKWFCPSCSETLEKAAVHQDLGLRPRGPRLTAGNSVMKSKPKKNRRQR